MRAAVMKHDMRDAVDPEPAIPPSRPNAARVAPEYAVIAAAMLFMCRPGTSPAQNPVNAPATEHTEIEARRTRSAT